VLTTVEQPRLTTLASCCFVKWLWVICKLIFLFITCTFIGVVRNLCIVWMCYLALCAKTGIRIYSILHPIGYDKFPFLLKVTLTLLVLKCTISCRYEQTGANFITSLPKGKHSCKGVGMTCPDPDGNFTDSSGIVWPMGKGMDNSLKNSSLLYNEYPFCQIYCYIINIILYSYIVPLYCDTVSKHFTLLYYPSLPPNLSR
jgi:hypothetical protein